MRRPPNFGIQEVRRSALRSAVGEYPPPGWGYREAVRYIATGFRTGKWRIEGDSQLSVPAICGNEGRCTTARFAGRTARPGSC